MENDLKKCNFEFFTNWEENAKSGLRFTVLRKNKTCRNLHYQMKTCLFV